MKADLDRLMAGSDIDALWITGAGGTNVPLHYFVGNAHLTSADLIKKRGEPPVLFHRTAETAEAVATGLEIVAVGREDLERWAEAAQGDSARAKALRVRHHLAQLEVEGRVAVHGQLDAAETLAVVRHLGDLLPSNDFIADAGPRGALKRARLTKDEDEIERIRRMGQTSIEIVERISQWLSEGGDRDGILVNPQGNPVTVGDVKRRIHLLLAERGSVSPLGPIVAPGREGAEIHHTGSDDQPMPTGMTIIFDLYPREIGGGYHFDFTRTWCLGPVPASVMSLYGDVREVYEEVLPMVRAGASPRALQIEVCQRFEERGHGSIRQHPVPESGYLHALGHGLGLELHEAPLFRHYETDAEFPLEAGMVLTFEPGLYYPGEGMAVRLEDTILVRPEGPPEILAPYPLEIGLSLANA